MTEPTKVKHAAVLGAGTIGASWAAFSSDSTRPNCVTRSPPVAPYAD